MSNVAPQPFDAYHKWLGIPPAEQPPTCYRLLGIPVFESDPDVIDAAADQRMAHLRKYQTGSNSTLSQQLLNEVASARIVLLSPDKKAAYDAELRAKLAAAARAAETKPVVHGAGESSAIGRGKGEPSSLGGKRPPRLPVAVALDPVTPAAAASATVPAARIPVVMPPPVTPGAAAPTLAEFTPLPMATSLRPKPQNNMANLIVGGSVAAVIALVVLGFLLMQGQDKGSPSTPVAADTADSPAKSHPPVAPVSPPPPPHPEVTKAVVPIPPTPLEPAEGALLCDKGRPENQDKGWDFRWSPVDRAVKYHLRVTRPGDNEPPIDNPELPGPAYHSKGIVPLPLPGGDRRGWRWKVRAMVDSQSWTDWSPERTFDIEPKSPSPVPPAPPATTVVTMEPAKPQVATVPAAPSQPEPPSAETAARPAPPDDAAVEKASKEVNDVYANDYKAARTPAQKVVLAKKLLDQASATQNDPPARYVLLKSARDLAGQAGDAAVAIQAVDAMSAAFNVDGTGIKVETLNEVANAKVTLSPAQVKDLVDQILAVMDELIEQDRAEEATPLVSLAMERARRTHDGALIKQVNQQRQKIAASRKSFAEVKPFAQRLRTQPDDAEANYRLGRYSVTVRNNWTKGLSLLAKGSDASWKKLAQQELASPSASGEQLALADGWWEAAQTAEETEKNGLLLHAGTWYRKAQPGVAAGLNKTRVEKRLAQIDQLSQPSPAPEPRPLLVRPSRRKEFKVGNWVDILSRVDVARDQVSGQWKRTKETIAGSGSTSCTRLMLPVAVEGSYDLQVTFVPINTFDRVIVIVPIGSHGCAIYETTTSVGIYAAQQGAFAGSYRLVTSRGFGIINGLPQHTLGISVRLDGDTANISVAVDGAPQISYPCSKDSLDVPAIYALPSAGHPGLGTMETDTALFGVVKFCLISGKAAWAETPAANKPAVPPAVPGVAVPNGLNAPPIELPAADPFSR